MIKAHLFIINLFFIYFIWVLGYINKFIYKIFNLSQPTSNHNEYFNCYSKHSSTIALIHSQMIVREKHFPMDGTIQLLLCFILFVLVCMLFIYNCYFFFVLWEGQGGDVVFFFYSLFLYFIFEVENNKSTISTLRLYDI